MSLDPKAEFLRVKRNPLRCGMHGKFDPGIRTKLSSAKHRTDGRRSEICFKSNARREDAAFFRGNGLLALHGRAFLRR
ncbi:MAG: hypothetical protein KA004_00945 [Verrucomicrobiales bacterium]|nr:hypothetical protein [Verrucomicrobiales bacterium]